MRCSLVLHRLRGTDVASGWLRDTAVVDPDGQVQMLEQPAETCAERVKDRGPHAPLLGDVSSPAGVAAIAEELLGTAPVRIQESKAGWLVLLAADETNGGMPKLFVATSDMTVRCLPAGVPTARAVEAPFEWVCEHAELLARITPA